MFRMSVFVNHILSLTWLGDTNKAVSCFNDSFMFDIKILDSTKLWLLVLTLSWHLVRMIRRPGDGSTSSDVSSLTQVALGSNYCRLPIMSPGWGRSYQVCRDKKGRGGSEEEIFRDNYDILRVLRVFRYYENSQTKYMEERLSKYLNNIAICVRDVWALISIGVEIKILNID